MSKTLSETRLWFVLSQEEIFSQHTLLIDSKDLHKSSSWLEMRTRFQQRLSSNTSSRGNMSSISSISLNVVYGTSGVRRVGFPYWLHVFPLLFDFDFHSCWKDCHLSCFTNSNFVTALKSEYIQREKENGLKWVCGCGCELVTRRERK